MPVRTGSDSDWVPISGAEKNPVAIARGSDKRPVAIARGFGGGPSKD
ncbi:MAG: hypothetical protein AB7F88_11195 [Pyrinomonadaceae bacterium]